MNRKWKSKKRVKSSKKMNNLATTPNKQTRITSHKNIRTSLKKKMKISCIMRLTLRSRPGART